jgi:hypothetical protein
MAATPADTLVGPSAVHGRGLFAARDLPARHSLGELIGENLTAAEFQRRQRAGGVCLVRFTALDGEEVFLDGAGRCTVAHVNSVQGLEVAANVEFVSDGARVEVVTLVFVPQGTELLADYAVARAGEWHTSQGRPVPPPARAPGAPVLRGSCADFERRLQSAICDGGGFAEREPLAWAAQGSGSGGADDWLAFLACFGAATSVAEAAKAVRFKLPGAKGPRTPGLEGSQPPPRVSELHRLVDPAEIGACVPPTLVAALQRACVASPLEMHVFLGRGADVEAGKELGWELGGCVLRVLCGALDVWLAAGTVENAQLFGGDPERPASDYAGVRRTRLEAGALLFVPGGCVWQMSCGGDEVVAVAIDLATPVDAWDVAAGLAYRLRPGQAEASRRRAAATVAACFKLDAVETPEAALKAMRASYWGDRLGGLQSPHACAGATPA